MKHIFSLIFIIACATLCIGQQANEMQATAAERARRSGEILKQFSSLGEASLPVELLRKAKAVAVFPGLNKVNVLLDEIITGNGMISVRGDAGWSTPVFLAFKGVDLNFKMAGKKQFDAVLLFIDDEPIELLKTKPVPCDIKKRRMGLGPVIRGEGADRTLRDSKVIYYAMQDGQIIDTDLKSNGAYKVVGLVHDNHMNRAVFGEKARELFMGKAVTVPAEIEKFRTVLSEAATGAPASGK